MDNLTILVNRLKKLQIDISLAGNYPWIYLDKINGKRVKEKYLADHGFTIAWYPKFVGGNAKLTDLKEIFKLIRKYVVNT